MLSPNMVQAFITTSHYFDSEVDSCRWSHDTNKRGSNVCGGYAGAVWASYSYAVVQDATSSGTAEGEVAVEGSDGAPLLKEWLQQMRAAGLATVDLRTAAAQDLAQASRCSVAATSLPRRCHATTSFIRH